MHDFLESALACLASNALIATLLAAAAWTASRWSKPTIAHALWLLVLVKLVTPPLVDVPLPLSAIAAAFVADGQPANDDGATLDATHRAAWRCDAEPESVLSRLGANEAVDPGPRQSTSDEGAGRASLWLDVDGGTSAAASAELQPLPPDAGEHSLESSSTVGDVPTVVWSSPSDVDGTDFDRTGDSRAEHMADPQDDATHLSRSSVALGTVAAARDESPRAIDLPRGDDDGTGRSSVVPMAAVAVSDDSERLAWPAFALPTLAGVWLCGALAWFSFAAVRLRRFHRAMRDATAATPPLQAEVARLAERIGLRRVPDVRIVAAAVSPLVWMSLGRTVLVLPRELLARFSTEQRAAVIAHELAHLRRRDHWTRWLELAAIACYWWLPTAWLARRQIHQAEEACCDTWVVWLLPERRREYARALLETIDFLHPASETPLLASGFARPSSLKRRFDMILKTKAPHRLSWPGRIAVVAAGLFVLPWTLSAVSAQDEAVPAKAVETQTVETQAADTSPPSSNDDSAVESTTVPATPSVDAAPRSGAGSKHDAVRTLSENDEAQVLQRLARLEATTAELLAIVKQLRDEQEGSSRFPTGLAVTSGGRGFVTGGRLGGSDDAVSISIPLERDGRPITVKVSGRQIDAVDANSGKTLWSTVAPANVSVIQSKGPEILEAIAADGTTLVIGTATGKIMRSTRSTSAPNKPKGENVLSGAAATVDRGTSFTTRTKTDDNVSFSTDANAQRSEHAAKVEMEMLAMERKLAIERADLRHEVRLLETRRDRLSRKLDTFPRGPENADEYAKLTATLEEAEDQLTAMQHRVDVFEADLEFKLRELQIRRDQLLRGVGTAWEPQPNVPPRTRR